MHTGPMKKPKSDDNRHMPCSLPSSPSTYWDNLSKIWLTRDALEELDRRNSYPEPSQKPHRPITRRFYAELKKHCKTSQFASDFLRDCGPASLKQIKSISRHGGLDLSDLRNYHEPGNLINQAMTQSKSKSRRRKRPTRSSSSPTPDTTAITKTTMTAYNRNFQQHLVDHKIYPDGYEYPGGRIPALPNNWTDITERLARHRPSLSSSDFSEEDFRKFKRANTRATKEQPVAASVIPTIEGDWRDSNCGAGGLPLRNLAPLADGNLAQVKPDRYYGARPEQLDPQVRNNLNNHIIPSTQGDLPILPNFFLEAKGPDGSLPVVARQACYDGALGARGMHSLQSYQRDESIYDDNAYTLTATYHGGILRLYATHLTKPEGRDRPEYIMNLIDVWAMVGNSGNSRQGATAYRNALNWAEEKRNEFIRLANERQPEQSQSRYGTASEVAATPEDSNVSSMSDATECQDTQRNLAASTEGMEDEDEILSRKNRSGGSIQEKVTARLN